MDLCRHVHLFWKTQDGVVGGSDLRADRREIGLVGPDLGAGRFLR